MVDYIPSNRGSENHSYEEIRRAVLDILTKREQVPYDATQFKSLEADVGYLLAKRDTADGNVAEGRGEVPPLSDNDARFFQEVFWDLFRQGIITLGLNRSNENFPFFRVSSYGERILAGEGDNFFHDVSAYESLITKEVPDINDVTMMYAKEAMQDFMSGCLLSSSVMIGVATEDTVLRLIEVIDAGAKHETVVTALNRERQILAKVNRLIKFLESQLSHIPPEVREDLDTNCAGILSLIRTFRNDSGHPTGKIISREQQYVHLQLFIPYCKKMYQLMAHFAVA